MSRISVGGSNIDNNKSTIAEVFRYDPRSDRKKERKLTADFIDDDTSYVDTYFYEKDRNTNVD